MKIVNYDQFSEAKNVLHDLVKEAIDFIECEYNNDRKVREIHTELCYVLGKIIESDFL